MSEARLLAQGVLLDHKAVAELLNEPEERVKAIFDLMVECNSKGDIDSLEREGMLLSGRLAHFTKEQLLEKGIEYEDNSNEY